MPSVRAARRCEKAGCDGIIASGHEASIKKYLDASYGILEEFEISEYTKHRVELLKMEIESLFKEDLKGQKELSYFVS